MPPITAARCLTCPLGPIDPYESFHPESTATCVRMEDKNLPLNPPQTWVGAALSSQKKVEANKKMAGTEKNAGCMTDRFRPKRPSNSPKSSSHQFTSKTPSTRPPWDHQMRPQYWFPHINYTLGTYLLPMGRSSKRNFGRRGGRLRE